MLKSNSAKIVTENKRLAKSKTNVENTPSNNLKPSNRYSIQIHSSAPNSCFLCEKSKCTRNSHTCITHIRRHGSKQTNRVQPEIWNCCAKKRVCDSLEFLANLNSNSYRLCVVVTIVPTTKQTHAERSTKIGHHKSVLYFKEPKAEFQEEEEEEQVENILAARQLNRISVILDIGRTATRIYIVLFANWNWILSWNWQVSTNWKPK